MPSMYSTTLAGNPCGSLDGVFLTLFTAPCSRSPFEIPVEVTGPYGQVFGWQCQMPGASFDHGVVLGTHSGVLRRDEDILRRLVCHYILSTIPNEGLPEVFQSLLDYRSYYLEENFRRPALPPAQDVVKAKWARTYDRPAFGVVGE